MKLSELKKQLKKVEEAINFYSNVKGDTPFDPIDCLHYEFEKKYKIEKEIKTIEEES